MGISSTRPLPTPAEVKAEFPMNGEHHIAQKRHTVKNIIAGTDKRLLMIVGPCSAWPLESMDEYAESLAALQNEVKDHVVCVLRTYI
jgi:3-deoxy-7-phosphoheptulonate synthase